MLAATLLAIFGLSALSLADLTVIVDENVRPLPLDSSKAVTSGKELLTASCPEEMSHGNQYHPEVLMSSFADFMVPDNGSIPEGNIFPSSGSLVRGAVEAWAQHQHLVLRPDEIWFEILTQLNFYMTEHAEDIRHLFVDHQGKEEIQIWALTWRLVVEAFAQGIQERIKTPWLYDWIMPGFSTTEKNDELTATVLMMGLMQHYFEFSGGIICGLPKVTLLGERQDWVKLLEKLDYLKEFGKEPKEYAEELRPILTRFVKTWDEPKSRETRDFWGNIVRANRLFTCGSRPEYDVSGWITGFMKWRPNGHLRVQSAVGVEGELDPQPERRETPESDGPLVLDGIRYTREPLYTLPIGYAKVPLKMLDYPERGEETMSYLLAGNIAVNRTQVSEKEFVKAQPLSAWFMYAPIDANYTIKPNGNYGNHGELVNIGDAITSECGTREERDMPSLN